MFHMLTTTEYAPVTDQDTLRRLLTRIAAGEREALAELYHCTRAAVYGLALSYLRNAQDAQDLTQDVYVRVWDHADQYRPTGSPLGWILTVCRNLCRTQLRREERHTAPRNGTPFPPKSGGWMPSSAPCCGMRWRPSVRRNGGSFCSTPSPA